MARSKTITGVCRICGQVGPLTFEHIPPRAAFNDRPVITADFDAGIRLGPDEPINGPIQQRGAGHHALCGKCNNDTGAWYARDFVDWCYQGMELLNRSNGEPSLIYLNYVFPLRILKQLAAMFLAINPDGFRNKNQELVRFVLNREARYLSPTYRFFVYYNIVGRFRSLAVGALLHIASGRSSILSEITFPPYGYVMTLDSPPPDDRLVEITHFARYDYNQFAVLPLKLPTLPTHISMPGDYRSKDQIYREATVQRHLLKGLSPKTDGSALLPP